MNHSVSLVAALAAGVCLIPDAHAAECAAKGQEALDAGRFAEAATMFEIAIENPACGAQLDPLRYGLGQAIAKQAEAADEGRRFCDAMQQFALVAESPDAALAEKGKAALAEVTGPCNEAWKGSLAVTCKPAEGEVFIERLGDAKACPAKFEGVAAGTYQGELRADGRSSPFIATVTPGADATLVAELGPAPGGGAVSTWAWVAAGGALAAFAGAGVSYLEAGRLADQAERPENYNLYDDLKADYDANSGLFYGLLGGGVVLTGVATWLFLDSMGGGDEAPASALVPTVTPDGFGLGWQGAW